MGWYEGFLSHPPQHLRRPMQVRLQYRELPSPAKDQKHVHCLDWHWFLGLNPTKHRFVA